MKEKYEIMWWKDWLFADTIKRFEMVQKLPFVQEMNRLSKAKIPKRILRHSLATVLNSFFEDLENAMYTKIEIENNKKNKSK